MLLSGKLCNLFLTEVEVAMLLYPLLLFFPGNTSYYWQITLLLEQGKLLANNGHPLPLHSLHDQQPPAGVAAQHLLTVSHQPQPWVRWCLVRRVALSYNRKPVHKPATHLKGPGTEVEEIDEQLVKGVGHLLWVMIL